MGKLAKSADAYAQGPFIITILSPTEPTKPVIVNIRSSFLIGVRLCLNSAIAQIKRVNIKGFCQYIPTAIIAKNTVKKKVKIYFLLINIYYRFPKTCVAKYTCLMAITSILSQVGKSMMEYEGAGSLAKEFFKKDAEVLTRLGELKTADLTESIAEHLVKDGRPGSAEYMKVLSKSSLLDQQLGLLENGTLVEKAGLPLMIDLQNTTPEMLKADQVVLNTEARNSLFGSFNSLKYQLDQHLTKSIRLSAETYATAINTPGFNLEILNGEARFAELPEALPFAPNSTELDRLKELAEMHYTSKEEIIPMFMRELGQMMKQRPEMIGLGTSARMAKHLEGIVNELGGNGGKAIETTSIRFLHRHMTSVSEELNIYPDFATAIENSIQKDFEKT